MRAIAHSRSQNIGTRIEEYTHRKHERMHIQPNVLMQSLRCDLHGFRFENLFAAIGEAKHSLNLIEQSDLNSHNGLFGSIRIYCRALQVHPPESPKPNGNFSRENRKQKNQKLELETLIATTK